MPLLQNYPYLLPTSVAASILFVGAILSLFLAWDGGPRQRPIQLPIEKPTDAEYGNSVQGVQANIDLGSAPPREMDDDRTPSFGALGNVMRTKVSGYFARRVREAYGQTTPTGTNGEVLSPSSPHTIATPLGSPDASRARAYSRNARFSGSAYGYRPRAQSHTSVSTAMRRGSNAVVGLRHRPSVRPEEPQGSVPQGDGLSLAQRLVIGMSVRPTLDAPVQDPDCRSRLANENAGASLPGLWVAAAINADNEDPFEGDDDEEIMSEEEDYGETLQPNVGRQYSRSFGGRHLSFGLSAPGRHRQSSPFTSRQHGTPFGATPTRRPSNIPVALTPSAVENGEATLEGVPLQRHMSISSHLLPAIYSNTGVSTPPALMEALSAQGKPSPGLGTGITDPFQDSLAPIVEGEVAADPVRVVDTTLVGEKPDLTFKWTLLPLFIIFQYFILCLHSTSHDQVFLMYVTS